MVAEKISNIWSAILARWRSYPPEKQRLLVVQCLLGVLLLLFLILLIKADKPYNGEIAERLESGAKLKLKHYIGIGLFYALSINSVLTLILLVTTGWWMKMVQLPRASEQVQAVPRRNRGLMVVGLLLLMFMAAALRFPYLDDALRRDEQDTMRRNVHGYFQVKNYGQPDQQTKFVSLDWRDAMFENLSGNNPVLYSISTQILLKWWRDWTNTPREYFHPVILRVVPFTAGVLSLWAIWLLLMELEMPLAAMLATGLAAVHPMHLQYSVEGRGYGLVMLFSVLMAYFLLKVLRSGDQWRNWVFLVLTQMALVYSNPGSIYWAFCLNAGLLGYLAWQFWRGKTPEERLQARGLLSRQLLANLFFVMACLMLLGPCVPQFREYFANTSVRGSMWTVWFTQSWFQYAIGHIPPMPEGVPREGFWIFPYLLENFVPTHPLKAFVAFVLVPGLLIVGAARVFRLGVGPAIIVAAVFVAPLLEWAHHNFVTGLYLYYWYVIFSFTTGLCLLSAGLDRVGRAIPARWGARAQHATVIALSLAFFTGFTVMTRSHREAHHFRTDAEYVDLLRGHNYWQTYLDGTTYCYHKYIPTDPNNPPHRGQLQ